MVRTGEMGSPSPAPKQLHKRLPVLPPPNQGARQPFQQHARGTRFPLNCSDGFGENFRRVLHGYDLGRLDVAVNPSCSGKTSSRLSVKGVLRCKVAEKSESFARIRITWRPFASLLGSLCADVRT
jgi:hypothetical protein